MMDPQLADYLPKLLGAAVLLPLASFFAIFIAGGKRLGHGGRYASWIAVCAIGFACLLSFASLGLWLTRHFPTAAHGTAHPEPASSTAADESAADESSTRIVRGQDPAATDGSKADSSQDEKASASSSDHPSAKDGAETHPQEPPATETHGTESHGAESHGAASHGESHAADAHAVEPVAYAGDFNIPGFGTPWVLGKFGKLRLSISYYIDALTVSMFCMVSFIATLIHIYAMGYMHDELHDVTDHEVTVSSGEHLHRPGRFHQFFQYLSLFCFSMLGLVVAGNIAMVFVFWELVGICSYFLIGFYVERKSASTAANKAFITNRVGDFGMIIGLMALWTSLGTFSFGDTKDSSGNVTQAGIFSQVRSPENHRRLVTPDGMVLLSARAEVAELLKSLGPNASLEEQDAAIKAHIPDWRDGNNSSKTHYGYWLLLVAGVGIFTGCVGKSAQFPLHVWLPDAMEGPTPVSALVHSATMVAAGVYLVGRFYPVFAPEVLFVIALTGCITLFLAATIAITATDIKRVLAYSTVSQLGYMMMSLGVGGWLAGMMHLITHAFFKSLLFMCSGSVIHAVHSNDMREMGGLLKKMPVTAYTMLAGCLAIAGAGIPFIMGWLGGAELAGLGFSGFYSKDAILEQAYSFMSRNTYSWGGMFFLAAAGGAAITAFYMFRMWYLTFLGQPRNQERYDHAHESPAVIFVPLIILAVMAVSVAWVPVQGLIGGLVSAGVFLVLKLMRKPSEAPTHDGHAAAHATSHAPSPAHDAGHGSTHDHGTHDHGHEPGHGHEHGHEHHAGHDGAPSMGWLPIADVPLAASVLVFAISLAIWSFASNLSLGELLESARPSGTLATVSGVVMSHWVWPNEHDVHVNHALVIRVTLMAIGTAFVGFMLATVMYGLRRLNADDVRRQFPGVYRFLINKWWFDELYDAILIRPTHVIARFVAGIDRNWIDRFIDGLAAFTKSISIIWDRIADRTVVDGLVNLMAGWTYSFGLSLRAVQTGKLRQYVMFIVIGAVAIFVLISIWNSSLAG